MAWGVKTELQRNQSLSAAAICSTSHIIQSARNIVYVRQLLFVNATNSKADTSQIEREREPNQHIKAKQFQLTLGSSIQAELAKSPRLHVSPLLFTSRGPMWALRSGSVTSRQAYLEKATQLRFLIVYRFMRENAQEATGRAAWHPIGVPRFPKFSHGLNRALVSNSRSATGKTS